MPEKYTYLLVDFLCIIFPFAFSFHPKISFYKQWKYAVLPGLVTAFIFIVWDIFFTEKGVWSFNPNYILRISLFHLPIEEYLFFICIPYACVFTFYCLNLFFDLSGRIQATKVFSSLLVVFLIVIALLHIYHFYTSVTFLFLAIFLSVLLIKKAAFLFSFYISFLVILIPFFLSNGILTGSLIATPVVLYNNNYNLGIRMFTIPVEDTFYGMLLMLMNVTGYVYLKNKNS